MVKLTEVLYVHQAVKNILSILRLVSNGATMEATQEKRPSRKRRQHYFRFNKRKNESMMFYLKAKIYTPEGYNLNNQTAIC